MAAGLGNPWPEFVDARCIQPTRRGTLTASRAWRVNRGD